jgi:hypothetical protein
MAGSICANDNQATKRKPFTDTERHRTIRRRQREGSLRFSTGLGEGRERKHPVGGVNAATSIWRREGFGNRHETRQQVGLGECWDS